MLNDDDDLEILFEGDWTGKEKVPEIKPSSGFVFEGAFLDGLPSGKGKFYSSNKTNNLEYEGDWFKGKRLGKGSFSLPEGQKYVG